MAKKKDKSELIDDLFADLDTKQEAAVSADEQAKSSQTSEMLSDDKQETAAGSGEPLNEAVSGSESLEVSADETQTHDVGDGVECSVENDEVDENKQPARVNAGKHKIPSILCDETPAESNGELTLARYAASAYLEYALSVVKSRALPDIFDGMKPVQRRILYAMDRMRLNPPAKAVKCARVVGDVLGKYHPHGDQAAYDAMVRMAQDFSLRYPLVDGEGNFGSRDGDGPAAMRYTEARLTKISELVLSELDSDDVKFVPNYDGSFKEPVQLPAKLPFVLLNGASGIAVGMATEIPSHNLNEVAQAVLLLLKNPQASLDEILSVMPGPDYPGGGRIISSPSEIRQTYAVGRGSLRVRACYHFEELQRGQWQLVVDELPPAANAEMVLSQIEEITNPKPKAGKKTISAEQANNKTAMLSVLDSVRNECDKDTKVRLVFEPKSSKVDRDFFVQMLLSQTSLECNAPMNLVMIGNDGRPAQKDLRQILSEWVQARLLTVRRRTQARLDKVNARLHILQGRVKAISNIDRVIEIVRFEDKPKEVLMAEFALTELQAEDILELRLRQLAKLEFERVEEEMNKLDAERETLEKILADEKTLKNVVARETKEAAKLYGDARRTKIEEAKKANAEPVQISEAVTVVISEKGYVRCRTGHGHDVRLMSYKQGDAYAWSVECESVDTLIVCGSNGRTYSVPVSQLPSARGEGLPLTSFIELESGSEIVGYLAGPDDMRVMLYTTEGFGLACTLKNLVARVRSGKAFMSVGQEARLCPPLVLPNNAQYVACMAQDGRLLVFELEELRTLSGGGKGVTLMGGIDLFCSFNQACALQHADSLEVRGATKSTSQERSKLLRPAEWHMFIAHRARKGKVVPCRFEPQGIAVAPAEPVLQAGSEQAQ